MEAFVNIHQLSLLTKLIGKQYELYGHQEKNGRLIFDKLENVSDLYLGLKRKTAIPFKKIIFPNHRDISASSNKKIALIGLNNCDVWALDKFYKEFEGHDLLMPKTSIFILVEECFPDENCFCGEMGSDKKHPSTDLYLQKEKVDYSIFTHSKRAEKILGHIKTRSKAKPIYKPIESEADFNIDPVQISKTIENRTENESFWQAIADNCFGCGACTAVCPLCYCTRQDFENTEGGECRVCLNWDTCFSKRFSEIQNHFDFRPQNLDRLYNWYHHKFVRAYAQNKQQLCVGCGRCIRACPANLNIKSILKNISKKSNTKPEST